MYKILQMNFGFDGKGNIQTLQPRKKRSTPRRNIHPEDGPEQCLPKNHRHLDRVKWTFKRMVQLIVDDHYEDKQGRTIRPFFETGRPYSLVSTVKGGRVGGQRSPHRAVVVTIQWCYCNLLTFKLRSLRIIDLLCDI